MSETKQGTLVGVKRVAREIDANGRSRVRLTFGPDFRGVDTAETLLNALLELQGKQFTLDIRIEEKESARGKFDTAFLIVKEMVPVSEGKTKFVPKNAAKKQALNTTSNKILKSLED